MAMKKTFDHPFKKGKKLTDAYVRMNGFAFNLLQGNGRIGYAVYKDEAARTNGKAPYPIGHMSADVGVTAEEGDAVLTSAGLKASAIAKVLSHGSLAEATKTDNGYIEAYEDPHGETHPEALISPILMEVDIIQQNVSIGLGVWAREQEFLDGAPAIGQYGTYRLQSADADTFIAEMDEGDKGRSALYAYSKSKEKYADAVDLV